jgi:non-ribosomal peptide synthetase component E (peptide arylation enzyme)
MDIPAHVEHLDPKPELLREFCGHPIAPGDETVVMHADGKPVEIPVCDLPLNRRW